MSANIGYVSLLRGNDAAKNTPQAQLAGSMTTLMLTGLAAVVALGVLNSVFKK